MSKANRGWYRFTLSVLCLGLLHNNTAWAEAPAAKPHEKNKVVEPKREVEVCKPEDARANRVAEKKAKQVYAKLLVGSIALANKYDAVRDSDALKQKVSTECPEHQ